MAAQFTNISIEEMESFLTPQGFRKIELPNTKEAVYAKRVNQEGFDLSLRVFTGIEGSNSREVGNDAIRVSLFYRNKEGEIFPIQGDRRVHRVKGWKHNLQSRLDSFKVIKIERCPKCGEPMIPMSGKAEGRGLRCSAGKWDKINRQQRGCNGTIWFKIEE